jgi:FAM91 C-terminus
MMGSLSPGMKKHSVTLFEGGAQSPQLSIAIQASTLHADAHKQLCCQSSTPQAPLAPSHIQTSWTCHAGRLAGKSVIADLREELWSSVKAGAAFEGEMAHIVGVLESLGTIIDTACYAEQGHPVEVIRKESLSMLAPQAATRMLQLAYTAIIAIDPLPGPPLPLTLAAPAGPALFGAAPAMLSPWLILHLLAELKAGPVSLAFTCGQCVSSLPPQVCVKFCTSI